MSDYTWLLLGVLAYGVFVALAFVTAVHYVTKKYLLKKPKKAKNVWDPLSWKVSAGVGTFIVLILSLLFIQADEEYSRMYRGQAATSLEPGTYYIHAFYTRTNEHLEHSFILLLDEEPLLPPENPQTPQGHIGKARLIELKAEEVDIENSDLLEPGWYEVTRVTICVADNNCFTQHHFENLEPEQEVPHGGGGGGQPRIY